MIDEHTSLTDIAFAVCTSLDQNGIEAILTGGSAAAYYAPQTVQSHDADFVLRFGANGGLTNALSSIGFRRTPNHYFAHPRSQYTVEFPAGPLAVGRETISSWDTVRRNNEVLYVLHPTDCVRDRFIAFYAWGDLSALSSALSVTNAIGDSFDEKAFCTWAQREAADDSAYDLRRLDIFLTRLHGSPTDR